MRPEWREELKVLAHEAAGLWTQPGRYEKLLEEMNELDRAGGDWHVSLGGEGLVEFDRAREFAVELVDVIVCAMTLLEQFESRGMDVDRIAALQLDRFRKAIWKQAARLMAAAEAEARADTS